MRQPLNLSTPSPRTLPLLPRGSVPLPLPTPPGVSILPSLSLTKADFTPPPLPPFLGGTNLPPPLLEVSHAPPPLQFYSNVISRRIYSALTTTTERTYLSTTQFPRLQHHSLGVEILHHSRESLLFLLLHYKHR